MPLEASICARKDLPPDTREAMLELHGRYFSDVRRTRFMQDLEDKDWVILLHAATGVLAGFSTQQLLMLPMEGRTVRFLYSGDTIVDRAHWNTPFLAGCFGHLMLRLIETYGPDDLFWFLISKGFRTYRFLPVFFHRYWPAPERETPGDMTELLHAVSTHQFDRAYDRQAGVIRPRQGDRLAPDLAGIPPARLRDPHVAFFLERNPGYARGDELACIAPIRSDNLNAYAQRVIRVTTPVWKC